MEIQRRVGFHSERAATRVTPGLVLTEVGDGAGNMSVGDPFEEGQLVLLVARCVDVAGDVTCVNVSP